MRSGKINNFLLIIILSLISWNKSFSLPVRINVSSPAGPPPLGAIAETSIPFPKGEVFKTNRLVVKTSNGHPVLTQMRVSQHWPDGSIRWLHITFEAESGPGDYFLTYGDKKIDTNLINENENENEISIDTGEVFLLFPKNGGPLVKEISAPDSNGKNIRIVGDKYPMDIFIVRQDGKIFMASLDNSRRIIIEEIGPVKASLRIEGKFYSQDRERLFDYIIRWQVYRSRPEILITFTWINTNEELGVFLRDIRFTIPFLFLPNRLVFGCENGVYDGPFLKDWPVFILQEDYNRYWALTENPDGRIQHLASGGCNGKRFPGWLYLRDESNLLGVWVPNFWEEYPNEIRVEEGKLSIGLWPERASEYLSSKPILPADIDGKRYHRLKYGPVMPHPYLAFFDKKNKCLDIPQGVAKTHEIILSFWAGKNNKPSFEKKWWNRSLYAIRAHVDPFQVAKSQTCGPLWPRDLENFSAVEQIFDECFGWFYRHIRIFECYGKFDYGDFRYFIPSPTYMCHPGTKWGHMGEMPREGYWNNNERDPLRGILLYYLRSGKQEAWELCKIMARHILDIDISHYPRWGMYTHTYGHCYLGINICGNPDHSWFLGLLEWVGVSGDFLAWEWILKCGEELLKEKKDFTSTDCRNAAMQVHIMTQFYLHTGDKRYLESAKKVIDIFIKLQKSDGSWPGRFSEPDGPPHPSFTEHAIMALADYFDATKDERILPILKKALKWALPGNGKDLKDVSEAGLILYGVAVVAENTNDPVYGEIIQNIFNILNIKQNRSSDSICRGDWYPIYEVYNVQNARDDDRPPQFCGQSRPLIPATVLAYAPRALWILAKQKGLKLPQNSKKVNLHQ